MKPERFISLLLFVASALVIGITSGLIVGMTDVHKSTLNYQQPSAPVTPTSTAASTPVSAAPANPPEDSPTLSAGDTSEDPTKDLSGSDIAQVENMLETLGYNVTAGIVPAVQKYQEDNALSATGALDINTLQSMVNQIRVNRVKQLESNKAS